MHLFHMRLVLITMGMHLCRGLLQPSQQQHLITGLNLLRLLVQNRIAEFHTELELIPQEVLAR